MNENTDKTVGQNGIEMTVQGTTDVCRCGHLKMYHKPSEHGVKGHGACSLCECVKFTWTERECLICHSTTNGFMKGFVICNKCVEEEVKKQKPRQKDRLVWNKDKTACVKIHKIREITIIENVLPNGGENWTVRGWYNGNDYFCFGDFPTKEEAQKFIETLNGV